MEISLCWEIVGIMSSLSDDIGDMSGNICRMTFG